MSGSINKVILVGNLGRDPEVRTMGDGSLVVNLSIATGEQWKDKDTGEKKERTEWHRVVIFNENLAKVAQNYLRKGSTVYIEGQNQTRKWTDQKGLEKYTTEVVLQRYRGELTMLGGGSKSGPGFADDPEAYGNTKTLNGVDPGSMAPAGQAADLDDDIPF